MKTSLDEKNLLTKKTLLRTYDSLDAIFISMAIKLELNGKKVLDIRLLRQIKYRLRMDNSKLHIAELVDERTIVNLSDFHADLPLPTAFKSLQEDN